MPCGTTKKIFGNLTLCLQHKQKVGIAYYLLLAFHDKGGHSIFEQAQRRQKRRYSTFPTRKRMKEWQEVNNKMENHTCSFIIFCFNVCKE
jgi:hypothetical protein